jgi:hypothetical protein
MIFALGHDRQNSFQSFVSSRFPHESRTATKCVDGQCGQCKIEQCMGQIVQCMCSVWAVYGQCV